MENHYAGPAPALSFPTLLSGYRFAAASSPPSPNSFDKTSMAASFRLRAAESVRDEGFFSPCPACFKLELN